MFHQYVVSGFSRTDPVRLPFDNAQGTPSDVEGCAPRRFFEK